MDFKGTPGAGRRSSAHWMPRFDNQAMELQGQEPYSRADRRSAELIRPHNVGQIGTVYGIEMEGDIWLQGGRVWDGVKI